ncbi:hypothetical protein A0H81_13826 [Grifola frondosa]|uniref:Uncharacterized protein n=1 Tax=Grifola frondosa TaxID=5627 RepID=A0A1C7LQJ6_GRIFR|nr:hypothetical protein A0H81_13826 [Grifola frondosa]
MPVSSTPVPRLQALGNASQAKGKARASNMRMLSEDDIHIPGAYPIASGHRASAKDFIAPSISHRPASSLFNLAIPPRTSGSRTSATEPALPATKPNPGSHASGSPTSVAESTYPAAKPNHKHTPPALAVPPNRGHQMVVTSSILDLKRTIPLGTGEYTSQVLNLDAAPAHPAAPSHVRTESPVLSDAATECASPNVPTADPVDAVKPEHTVRSLADLSSLTPISVPGHSSVVVDATAGSNIDASSTQGELFGIRQDMHELGQHLARFTNALVSLASHPLEQPRSTALDAEIRASDDAPMEIDDEAEYGVIQAGDPPPPWAIAVHEDIAEVRGELRSLGQNFGRFADVLAATLISSQAPVSSDVRGPGRINPMPMDVDVDVGVDDVGGISAPDAGRVRRSFTQPVNIWFIS